MPTPVKETKRKRCEQVEKTGDGGTGNSDGNQGKAELPDSVKKANKEMDMLFCKLKKMKTDMGIALSTAAAATSTTVASAAPPPTPSTTFSSSDKRAAKSAADVRLSSVTVQTLIDAKCRRPHNHRPLRCPSAHAFYDLFILRQARCIKRG